MKAMQNFNGSKKLERGCYTLIEMLCVISITAALFSIVGTFFYDGTRICRAAIARAEADSETAIIRGKWRAFIKKCNGNIVLKNGALICDNASARFENNKLVLSCENEKLEILVPEKTGADISIEKNMGMANCIVLNITFPDGRKKRIVACNEEI